MTRGRTPLQPSCDVAAGGVVQVPMGLLAGAHAQSPAERDGRLGRPRVLFLLTVLPPRPSVWDSTWRLHRLRSVSDSCP